MGDVYKRQVIYNRLCSKQYPLLQIDATIQYILEERKEELSAEDLAISSPYNTYKNPGLPAGPIANPGLNSIKAALYPQDTSYSVSYTHLDVYKRQASRGWVQTARCRKHSFQL